MKQSMIQVLTKLCGINEHKLEEVVDVFSKETDRDRAEYFRKQIVFYREQITEMRMKIRELEQKEKENKH